MGGKAFAATAVAQAGSTVTNMVHVSGYGSALDTTTVTLSQYGGTSYGVLMSSGYLTTTRVSDGANTSDSADAANT